MRALIIENNQAYRDLLAHSLMEFSEKSISTARRHRYPVSMLVIDLDHFKAVNDNHGHAVGDIVLQLTGALLNECLRDGDLVSRYGSEESGRNQVVYIAMG